ncbi:hypothetical protein ANN_24321 [Periplaneta americana]|uniref:Uncharacterized protein n=1 Tax=Periplaneta americana TaxID=6978 RepID=A0ABQ8S2S8_PERAM|nr:hypothetical protein ANN_24321 [Periplaneta americana]
MVGLCEGGNEPTGSLKGIRVKSTTLDEITLKQLRWYGHVKRMQEDKIPKSGIPQWKRKRERPTTWMDGRIMYSSGKGKGEVNSILCVTKELGEKQGLKNKKIYKIKGEKNKDAVDAEKDKDKKIWTITSTNDTTPIHLLLQGRRVTGLLSPLTPQGPYSPRRDPLVKFGQ